MLGGMTSFNMGLVRIRLHNPEPGVQHMRVSGANDGQLVIMLVLRIRVTAVYLQRRFSQIIGLLTTFPIFRQVPRRFSLVSSADMGLDPFNRVDAVSMV